MAPAPTWHLQQFDEPKRSTVHLADFAERHIGADFTGQALDVACGAGQNTAHLQRLLGGTWRGIDHAQELVDLGRARGLDLACGDLEQLTERYAPGEFDASFSLMTLSWLPDYETAVRQMLAVTDGWVIASSLFADTEFDAITQVRDREAGIEPWHYNVYSLDRFERFCRAQPGVSDFIAEPFDIDVDLPRPDSGMGSWTERTADGRRLTFSGPVWMPWWFVAIRNG